MNFKDDKLKEVVFQILPVFFGHFYIANKSAMILPLIESLKGKSHLESSE